MTCVLVVVVMIVIMIAHFCSALSSLFLKGLLWLYVADIYSSRMKEQSGDDDVHNSINILYTRLPTVSLITRFNSNHNIQHRQLVTLTQNNLFSPIMIELFILRMANQFLGNYLESIESVPGELQRNFTLMQVREGGLIFYLRHDTI